jgi:DNA primase
MGGDIEKIKDRLDIAEVVRDYVKLERAGKSFKGRCPFHNEKTPSFFVSPERQSYYCFGCGAKGDIFTFIGEMDGLSFKEALKSLAERAGVELKYKRQDPGAKDEEDLIRQAVEEAAEFFEKRLGEHQGARDYVKSRGIDEKMAKSWRLGYAPAEWRALYNHMLASGYKKEILFKAGLVKPSPAKGSEPYDVFRDRITFPLSDASGNIIAFSGRALAKETEPKYLNSPDTILFTKSEVLYGLDKAKEKIRRKNYAILVEGQIDLVLSHQAGVDNAVASSGTAFTQAHLERLKRLSPRIILAFDGDKAGRLAAEKAALLAMLLGLEVKIARLPEGKDPADMAKNHPEEWKEVLRKSLPAIEHFLNLLVTEEKDPRKLGKLIEKKLLPLLALLDSSIERSHFISLISKKTGIKEDVIWEDLRKTRVSVSVGATRISERETIRAALPNNERTRKELIAERLTEVRQWLRELPEKSAEAADLKKEEAELNDHLSQEALRDELAGLTLALSAAETSKDEERVKELALSVQKVLKRMRDIEEKRKVL